MADDQVADLRSTWETAAPGWAKWEAAFSAGLAEVTEALLDMAGVADGQRVLDLACGAGSQTMRAAARVGSSGSVVAVDISGTMLVHVCENARRIGLNNIRTIECAAEDLDPAQAPFDAAISRLGLMLFAAPGLALASIERVLKPKARFAALVFTTPANNPFMAKPMQVLLHHANKEPPALGQPGIFALGKAGVLPALMTSGGLVDLKEQVLRAPLRLASAAEALQMMQQAFGAYRAVAAELSDDKRREAWAEVAAGLQEFEGERGFETNLEFVTCSGAKPG